MKVQLGGGPFRLDVSFRKNKSRGGSRLSSFMISSVRLKGQTPMKEKQEAERLFWIIRSQIQHGHDPKHIHQTTKSVCSEVISTIIRAAADPDFWYGVKMELGKI